MRRHLGRFERFAIAVIVCGVSAVPAFAQSDNERPIADAASTVVLAADRSSVGAMRVYAAAHVPPADVPLPPNLSLPDDLRPLVESMLRRSATFRRQCLRIADASSLTIGLRYYRPATERVRARSQVTTTADLKRVAQVELSPLGDAVELIAHEFEHVIEQLDGVDLSTRAALPATGVHMCDGGGYETTRAIRAGVTVAEEVRRRFP